MTLLWAWKVQLWPADVPRRLVALLHVSFRKKFPEVDLRYGSTHYGVAAELSLSLEHSPVAIIPHAVRTTVESCMRWKYHQRDSGDGTRGGGSTASVSPIKSNP